MMAETTRKIICIRCPTGCEITTTLDGANITNIEGNTCKLGEEHVRNEIQDPRRTVTSLVRVANGQLTLCPVWTTQAIPKDKILPLLKKLKEIELVAPVITGQILVQNFEGTGADVVASREIVIFSPEHNHILS